MSITFKNVLSKHKSTVTASHSRCWLYLAQGLDCWLENWRAKTHRHDTLMALHSYYFFSFLALLELCYMISWLKAGGFLLQKAPSFVCLPSHAVQWFGAKRLIWQWFYLSGSQIQTAENCIFFSKTKKKIRYSPLLGFRFLQFNLRKKTDSARDSIS